MIVTIKMKVAFNSDHRPAPKRIAGLDLARALALLGMIVVHFHLVVASGTGDPAWLHGVVESLQGRAAATFVVLAGIGGSLGSARARSTGDADLRRAARVALARRGLFLFVVGTLFLAVWPADILHSYGIWLGLGATLLFAPSWVLVVAAFLCIAANAAFVLSGRFFEHWNLLDLSYEGLWTPLGFVRNLLLDGWNPLFPWFALYVYGLLVGRLDLGDRRLRAVLGGVALVVALATWVIARAWAPPLLFEFRPAHLLMTSATPPTPAFVEFGAAVATLAIVASIEFALRFPRVSAPLVSTGQLALTLYIAHVIVGLGILEGMGRLGDQSLPFAVGAAFSFFGAAVVAAFLWRLKFSRGPLEAVMRWVS